MKIIEPITILNSMIGSGAGTVAEGDYAEYVLATTYGINNRVIVKDAYGIFGEPVQKTGTTYCGMTVHQNGNLYVCSIGAAGTIYLRGADDDDFIEVQGVVNRYWYGMCTSAAGNVYACCDSTTSVGDIYMQTAGSGTFASLGAADLAWFAMAAGASHVYACVYGGDIYKQTAGTGAFSTMSAGSKNWTGMAVSPTTGDVYACVASGDIWVQTAGAGAFAAIADTDRAWQGMAASADGTIWACVTGGDIYKRTGGAGTFAATGNTTRNWRGMCVDPTNGDIYAGVSTEGEIYVSRYLTVHKKYESLESFNLGNFPPSDVLATTPKWLEISSTNKWKVFDGKTTDQTVQVSPIVYTITPGVAVNSIALLNLSMTSYRVQGTSGAYDSGTVASTATDIVLTSLGGLAANVLTITITNSGGLAKCGEIVIGSYYSLGTLRPEPSIGIVDYSVKTTDDFGDYTITERAYSKKLNCGVKVINTSIDAVFNKLAGYRVTPLVWIGNTTYTSLIIYGYWKDFSLVIGYKTYSFCSLEIEGLT